MLYTTSLNCTTNANDAYLQMKSVYNKYAIDTFDSPRPLSGKGTVKAIHYIMSFADSEKVSPELAHKIARVFVKKAFGNDVQAVIATHVDADHVHNHVIINSYSLSGQKYIDNKSTLRRIREYTNAICLALNIKPALDFENNGRTIKYNEWLHKRNDTSWKENIRLDIDKIIPTVKSLDELIFTLEESGYEIKRGKYISLKAPGQKRFVRSKTLGEQYTEESLKARILYPNSDYVSKLHEMSKSELRTTYLSIIQDVRILADQHKKIERKRDCSLPYSADNDLDIYRLSAQLSVINRDNISSIGELEGAIKDINTEYEKMRHEANRYIDEYNNAINLLDQAKVYFELSDKATLTDSEKLKITVYGQSMESNNIHDSSDMDHLDNKAQTLNQKISALKKNLESCKQKFDVYSDIIKTYEEISCEDYIEKLIDEENKTHTKKRHKTI